MIVEQIPTPSDTMTEHEVDRVESSFTINMQGAPMWRKCMIVFTTSWITLSACFSSTLFFSTVDEIADEFNVPKMTVNIANAGVLLTLGMSTLVWGPVEMVSYLCKCVYFGIMDNQLDG
jgi:hypothetical protein